MEFFINEKNIILILNCISYTMLKLNYHPTLEQKKELENYFNFDNYFECYEDLKLLYRKMSLNANKQLYNLNNEVFFVGQKNFLCKYKKNFNFLKNKKYNKKIKFFNFLLTKKIK